MKPAARLFLIHLSFCSASGATAIAQTPPLPQDPFLARVETLALIETFNGRLLAAASATATLEKWCADHRMASPAKIIARRMTASEQEPGQEASPETRRRLKAENGETIRHRHVQLMCGAHILSEADNWYVPARLPAEANLMLEAGDTPFGKAIQSLHASRRTIEAKILWSPLPEGWEMAAPATDAPFTPPHYLIEHRALLLTPDQTPISEVDEHYTREILDFDRRATPQAQKP